MPESSEQRHNRELIELLNELRVALPGVQVLFAFLLAVIFDQNVSFERAWRAPLLIQQRLGHCDALRMVAEPEAVA